MNGDVIYPGPGAGPDPGSGGDDGDDGGNSNYITLYLHGMYMKRVQTYEDVVLGAPEIVVDAGIPTSPTASHPYEGTHKPSSRYDINGRWWHFSTDVISVYPDQVADHWVVGIKELDGDILSRDKSQSISIGAKISGVDFYRKFTFYLADNDDKIGTKSILTNTSWSTHTIGSGDYEFKFKN
jgi:hypothetical protein